MGFGEPALELRGGTSEVANIPCDAELRIPGDLVYLRPVRAFIRELAESIGFRRERISDIELAVDEVFANAIEHGSLGSESRIVMKCLPTHEMISVVVSDTGQGRNPNTEWIDAWSDAVRGKIRPWAERGRGLLLARALADEMSMESNSVGGVDVHLVVYKER
jgi:anti-sigma regulatory factor (Ser/Thr protein kinase)